MFLMKTSTDGGTSFDGASGNYSYTTAHVISTILAATNSSSASSILLTKNVTTVGNDTHEGWSGVVRIIRPADASYTQIIYQGSWSSAQGNSPIPVWGSAQREAAANVDAIRFYFGAGNIASGKFRVYGVNKL